jgi:hypothetical protein
VGEVVTVRRIGVVRLRRVETCKGRQPPKQQQPHQPHPHPHAQQQQQQQHLLSNGSNGAAPAAAAAVAAAESLTLARPADCFMLLLSRDGSLGLDLSFVTHIFLLEKVRVLGWSS